MKYKPNQYLIDLKNDLSNWEQWLEDIRIGEEHKCSENEEYYDTAILKVSCIETNSPYYLIAARVCLADDKWVEDGEAEEVGELIESNFFMVNFCPYCGEKLMRN